MASSWMIETYAGSGNKPPLLRMDSYSKCFGDQDAGRSFTLTLHAGEIIGLLDAEGSTINLIAGLVKPTDGRIIFAGVDITDLPPETRVQRGIVKVRQTDTLFLDLTALENLLLGSAIRQPPLFPRQGGKTYRETGHDILQLAGLGDVADQPVAWLEPAQQSLLMIAIALTSRPLLLLVDEPARGMTKARRSELADILESIRQTGTSILFTEHPLWPLAAICDRVYALDGGEIGASERRDSRVSEIRI